MHSILRMTAQVRANPGSVRGVRCVLDKLQRALHPNALCGLAAFILTHDFELCPEEVVE